MTVGSLLELVDEIATLEIGPELVEDLRRLNTFRGIIGEDLG
jgi:hypothetical protein